MQQLDEAAASPSTVRVIESDDPDAWNAYVAGHPQGGLFHRAEWERVFAVYRLPVIRLMARREERIVGVVALVRQRSFLFGDHLVSLPWFDASGVLADDAEARKALVDQAVEWAQRAGIRTVASRQSESADLSPFARTDKLLMRLDLPRDPVELWDGFSPKVRNQVRKGEKAGLAIEQGGRELLADFYRVYATNMRDLGSPPHSRRFFHTILDTFTEESRLYVVRLEGNTVGAGFTMANGRTLEIPWASSLRRFNRHCVNHAMYWRILENACREGFSRFHFGRSSRDSGTYRFKKQWGAEPIQLYWYQIAVGESATIDEQPVQDSFGWQRRLWTHLPVWASCLMGPRIIAKVA